MVRLQGYSAAQEHGQAVVRIDGKRGENPIEKTMTGFVTESWIFQDITCATGAGSAQGVRQSERQAMFFTIVRKLCERLANNLG